MNLSIISAILLLIGLSGMIGSLAWVIRRGNNNSMTRVFMGCQISMILWLISQLLILFSSDLRQLWISYIIGNIGISFFAPLWLLFSAEYIEAEQKFRRLLRFVPIISISSICLILTNPIHKLYYAEFAINNVEYAPLFYVYQVIYYICIITGITLMCIKNTHQHNQITKQSILLTLSAAVPLAINTLSLTKIIKSKIELTPLFFAFSSIMILIALGRYGLLNINNIAMHNTISNINSGVIIFDMNDNVTYKNKYAAELLDIDKHMTFRRFIDDISNLSGQEISSDFISQEIELNKEFFDMKQSFCKNNSGTKVARVITVNNVTKYHELAAAEKKLSIEQERNRIAQEIHDSAGHTFTMISSLSKILHIEIENNRGDVPEMLEQISEIDGLSRSGVTQLRCSINNLREDEFLTSVTKAIQTVINAVRGIETEICVQGKEDKRYSFCIKDVYDNCRETITNAMRYSDASRIDIILKFLDERLEIYIFDNGKGCTVINENNGLKGIRERTERLGGSVKYSSVKNEGFTTIIKIPVRKDEKNDQRDNCR